MVSICVGLGWVGLGWVRLGERVTYSFTWTNKSPLAASPNCHPRICNKRQQLQHTHYHLTITKSKVREREGEELREDPERREIPVVALGSNQATRRRR
ncbi:unnamed protein product [Rhodiola kirilowii]